MKPVAWMLVDKNWNDFCRYSSYPTKGAIPLYTHPVKEEYESFDRTASHMAGEYVAHPVKELTDEEIEECYWGDGYPDNPRHPKEFAYAILRKAQEK